MKASVTMSTVDSGDSPEHLSHNSRKRQTKIDAQAAEITTMKTELNKALQENKRLKSLFSPEKMVEAMMKAVSVMTMQGHPRIGDSIRKDHYKTRYYALSTKKIMAPQTWTRLKERRSVIQTGMTIQVMAKE